MLGGFHYTEDGEARRELRTALAVASNGAQELAYFRAGLAAQVAEAFYYEELGLGSENGGRQEDLRIAFIVLTKGGDDANVGGRDVHVGEGVMRLFNEAVAHDVYPGDRVGGAS